MGAHGRDQFAAARRRRDALGQHFVDHADRQALEQRDALAQRRLELDLAAHRALGNGGDVRLQAGKIRQFVDAFLADHGGIHVGEKKLLAPQRLRLHDNVDRQVAARLAQAGAMAPMSSLPAKGMSTATSSNSHCAGPGEGRMARAPSTTVLSSAGSAGLQMSVATRDMQCEFAGRGQQGRAYRRADRQRQVGAGA